MAFEIGCKNCGHSETDHEVYDHETGKNLMGACDNWEAEKPLKEWQRKILRRDGVEVTH